MLLSVRLRCVFEYSFKNFNRMCLVFLETLMLKCTPVQICQEYIMHKFVSVTIYCLSRYRHCCIISTYCEFYNIQRHRSSERNIPFHSIASLNPLFRRRPQMTSRPCFNISPRSHKINFPLPPGLFSVTKPNAKLKKKMRQEFL